MDELTREFLIESQEGLDRMERCLTELEERPGDRELLADIFRSVHTIKGTTGFLGFGRLERLAHAGENLLGLLRDGRLKASAEIISGLLALLDGLRSILGRIEAEGSEGSGADDVMIEHLVALQSPATAEVRADGSAVPAAEVPLSPPAPLATVLLAAASASGAVSGHASGAASEPSASRTGIQNATESTLRVDVDLLNRMMNLVGELVLTRNQILQATTSDAGMTLLSRRLDMVTADLREAVMKARMQPVSYVFAKFPRLVRDLAQALGKRVRLEMEGQETELDKSLLEAIKDPLTHSVRNAVDHGIERPEARQAAGKDPEGRLLLRASQQGSHVLVEVVDDGGGIRAGRIRDKAIERRLITREKADQLTERELMQLIFLPGFSTAEAITNVSGRGVGMDVVRTNVEKIGGKVEIDSKPGQGTTLRLRIPLTLAIVPALIVRSRLSLDLAGRPAGAAAREQSFALPQGVLGELVHLTPEEARSQVEWIGDAPLYRLRGRLLPLVFLDRLLGCAEAGHTCLLHDLYIAVLSVDGRHYGLVVDGLADPEEIVVKPLSGVLKRIGLFSGATVLGNGEMALILDPSAVAARAGIRAGIEQEAASASAAEQARGGAEYLLVETGAGPAALPLSDVLRIERMPLSRIESLGGTPVLQFEGKLLPVDDAAGLLAAHPEATTASDPRVKEMAITQAATKEETIKEATIVVCRDGLRHVGVAVAQVLDVVAGAALETAGTGALAAGVTLLRDRVTRVVDLTRVPGLPAEVVVQESELLELSL